MASRRRPSERERRPEGEEAPAVSPLEGHRGPDSAGCLHGRLQRLGVQEVGVWPYRVHLVVCVDCRTTLTTETLRGLRRRQRAAR